MACKVILDTNFLLIPCSEGVDVYAELEKVVSCAFDFVVMRGSWGELDRLHFFGSSKERRQAKLAKVILGKKSVKIQDHHEAGVDDAIVLHARVGDIVATMDKELRRRLKLKGVDVAVLRQRSHVILIKA